MEEKTKTHFDHYYITNLTEQNIQFSKFAVCAGHVFSNHSNYPVVHEMHEQNVMTSNHSDNQRFQVAPHSCDVIKVF